MSTPGYRWMFREKPVDTDSPNDNPWHQCDENDVGRIREQGFQVTEIRILPPKKQ